MRNKLQIGLFLSIFSSAVFSDCIPHMCQDVFVQRLFAASNGLIYVATSGDETQLDCNAVSSKYLSFNLSDLAADVFYSTLLAAQISERIVSIRIVNGSQDCQIQYITHDR